MSNCKGSGLSECSDDFSWLSSRADNRGYHHKNLISTAWKKRVNAEFLTQIVMIKKRISKRAAPKKNQGATSLVMIKNP